MQASSTLTKPSISPVSSVNGQTGSVSVFSGAPNLKLSSFLSRSAYFGTLGTIPANFTVLHEVAAPAPYDYVRFVYLNFDTVDHTIGNTACASAPNQGNDGTGLTWSQMTFPSDPQNAYYLPGSEASSTDTTSVVVPASTTSASNNKLPGMAFSRWTALNSVARTDGKTLPLCQFRGWFAAGGLVGAETAAYTTPYLTGCGEHTFATQPSADSTGAKVTSAASNAIVASLSNTVWVFGFAQFHCTARGLTVSVFGDSIENGIYNTSTGVTPYNMVATAAISSISVPVSNANFGQHSGVPYSYLRRAWSSAENINADILLIKPFSPNSGVATDKSLWSAWKDAVKAINKAKSLGMDVIIVNTAPFGTPTLAQDNLRKSYNTSLVSLAISMGCYLLDEDSVISDGGSPAAVNAAYAPASGDTIHWNQAGHNAVSVPLQTILNQIIANRS